MSSPRRCRAPTCSPVRVLPIEFASQNQGFFRLMFGPILAKRAKYPALQAASAGVEAMMVHFVAEVDQRPIVDNYAAIAAWALSTDSRI